MSTLRSIEFGGAAASPLDESSAEKKGSPMPEGVQSGEPMLGPSSWGPSLYPPFPMEFNNVTVLTVCYRTDRAAVDAVLPSPLRSISDVVMMHIYDMKEVQGAGRINECNVMVGAAFQDISGGFSAALFVDSDVGLAHGREVHGQPKKLARISLETRQDLIVGTVERNGIDLITATTAFKRERSELDELSEHFDFRSNLNLKIIPAIVGGDAVRQLTRRRLEDVVVSECWKAPGTVELRPHALAPVWKLPVRDCLDAFYWRGRFTLVGGTTIHDYLEAET